MGTAFINMFFSSYKNQHCTSVNLMCTAYDFMKYLATCDLPERAGMRVFIGAGVG